MAPRGTKHPLAVKSRLFVSTSDPTKVDTHLPNGRSFVDLPLGTTSVPGVLVLPNDSGATTLHVMQQYRAVSPETGQESITGPVRTLDLEITAAPN